jgi:hypothetical protein
MHEALHFQNCPLGSILHRLYEFLSFLPAIKAKDWIACQGYSYFKKKTHIRHKRTASIRPAFPIVWVTVCKWSEVFRARIAHDNVLVESDCPPSLACSNDSDRRRIWDCKIFESTAFPPVTIHVVSASRDSGAL